MCSCSLCAMQSEVAYAIARLCVAYMKQTLYTLKEMLFLSGSYIDNISKIINLCVKIVMLLFATFCTIIF